MAGLRQGKAVGPRDAESRPKTQRKKLKLSKETLKDLAAVDRRVKGGKTGGPVTGYMTACGCPTTICMPR